MIYTYKRRLTYEEISWLLSSDINVFHNTTCVEQGAKKKIIGKYSDILQRCNKVNHRLYPHYGGRGIKVKISREEFYVWFLKEYKKFYIKFGDLTPSLSRINYDKGYEIGNIELTSISENTKELYRRRGNCSPSGTKLDDIQVLTCYTFEDSKKLAETYSVTISNIGSIKKGRNWKNLFKRIYGE